MGRKLPTRYRGTQKNESRSLSNLNNQTSTGKHNEHTPKLKSNIDQIRAKNLAPQLKSLLQELDKEEASRPLKRRKKRGEIIESIQSPQSDISSIKLDQEAKNEDEVKSENKSEYEVKSESENDEWEDVPIIKTEPNSSNRVGSNEQEFNFMTKEQMEEEIVLSIDKKDEEPTKSLKSNLISSEEKELRKQIHKLALLCLLAHVFIRNKWCNDLVICMELRKLVGPSIKAELFPPLSTPKHLRKRSFLDGLRHAMNVWRKKYFDSGRCSLYMKPWSQVYTGEVYGKIGRRVTLERFRTLVINQRGSRDIGAQGFCAMLRSVGVNARIVCSLQPPDFTNSKIEEPEYFPSKQPHKSATKSGKLQNNLISKIRSNLKQKKDSTSNVYISSDDIKSLYPVFWVEAWDSASERWITVDPIVQKIVEDVRSRSRLEPPLSDKLNMLRYVVAFNTQGFIKDVTRRYAQYYNAKTRNKRVTKDKNGQDWWNKALSTFKSPFTTDIDKIEDADFYNRAIQEGMPNSIQDFKDHPIYVLERHLRKNEVIYPKAPCGTLNLRTKENVVEVFKRENVKALKSARAWYMLGRVVKSGEKPLKIVNKEDIKDESVTEANLPNENYIGNLYAAFQTDLYIPPQIINGKLPKNKYGYIDIYTPNMVPKGATFLQNADMSEAARIVGVDYVRVVVGFEYGRGQSTPKIGGIIVLTKYEEAVRTIYQALKEDEMEELKEISRLKLLLKWKQYLTKLRIEARLNNDHGEVSTIRPNEMDTQSRKSTKSRKGKEKATNDDYSSSENESIEMPDLYSDSDIEFGIEDELEVGDDIQEGGFIVSESRAINEYKWDATKEFGDEKDFKVDEIEDGDEIGGGFLPNSDSDTDTPGEGGFISEYNNESRSNDGHLNIGRDSLTPDTVKFKGNSTVTKENLVKDETLQEDENDFDTIVRGDFIDTDSDVPSVAGGFIQEAELDNNIKETEEVEEDDDPKDVLMARSPETSNFQFNDNDDDSYDSELESLPHFRVTEESTDNRHNLNMHYKIYSPIINQTKAILGTSKGQVISIESDGSSDSENQMGGFIREEKIIIQEAGSVDHTKFDEPIINRLVSSNNKEARNIDDIIHVESNFSSVPDVDMISKEKKLLDISPHNEIIFDNENRISDQKSSQSLTDSEMLDWTADGLNQDQKEATTVDNYEFEYSDSD